MPALSQSSGTILFENVVAGEVTIAVKMIMNGSMAGGQIVQAYGHDGAGRIDSLTPPGASAITLGYDVAGRLDLITHPNGVTSAYGYDPLRGLLSSLTVDDGLGPVDDYTYTHDPVGNIMRAYSDHTWPFDRNDFCRRLGAVRAVV